MLFLRCYHYGAHNLLTLLKSGLFRRLFAATMFVTMFVIVIAVITSFYEYERQIRQATELRHDTVSQRMAMEMALFFEHASYELVMIADVLKNVNMPESSLRSALNDISLDAPHFTEIAVKKVDGTDIGLSIEGDRPSLQPSAQALEKAKSGLGWISTVQLDHNRVPYVKMTTPIMSSGEAEGIIVARLSLKKLWYWIDEINTESNTRLSLVKREDGSVIADQQKQFIGKTFPTWKKDRTNYTVMTETGLLYISYHEVPGVDLTIITLSSIESFLGYMAPVKTRVFVLAASLLLVALFTSTLFSARASRPVYKLIDHMNRYARYGQNTPTGLRGEYARIAEAFNDVVKILEENQRTIVAQESLVTVGRVSAILAHELRHELQMINNLVYVIDLTEEERSDLHKAVDDMAHKISSIMELARGSKIVPGSYMAEELMEEAVEFVLINYDNKQVEVAVQDGPPLWLTVDKAKMTMALSNLARNAIEAESSMVRLSCQVEKNHAVFSVADNGKGVNPEIQSQIMEPFFTTKQKGYGLGLSFVKSVAEAHGGTLRMESDEKGSTFQIIIPMSGLENIIEREQPMDATSVAV